MAIKGRRGYTKHGYPIVWLRKNTHEECMKKLEANAKKVTKGLSFKKRKIGGIEFQITSNDYCITLQVENTKTYYTTLGALAEGFKRILIRRKIKNAGMMTDLQKLIQIEKDTAKEIRALFTEGKV